MCQPIWWLQFSTSGGGPLEGGVWRRLVKAISSKWGDLEKWVRGILWENWLRNLRHVYDWVHVGEREDWGEFGISVSHFPSPPVNGYVERERERERERVRVSCYYKDISKAKAAVGRNIYMRVRERKRERERERDREKASLTLIHVGASNIWWWWWVMMEETKRHRFL